MMQGVKIQWVLVESDTVILIQAYLSVRKKKDLKSKHGDKFSLPQLKRGQGWFA